MPVALVGRVNFPRAWLRPLGEQAELLFSRAAACCYSGAILVASPASGPLAARFEGGQMPLHRRLPKRGFYNPFSTHYNEINVGRIQQVFINGNTANVLQIGLSDLHPVNLRF